MFYSECFTVSVVTMVNSDLTLLRGGYSSAGRCACFLLEMLKWRQALRTAMTVAQSALWLLRIAFNDLFYTAFN